MYQDVRVEITGGDPLAVERAFRERDGIQRHHMEEALNASLHDLQDRWKQLAPIGKGKPTDPKAPSWNGRSPGTYRESIHIEPPSAFEGDNLIGAVFSDDNPVARILETGSGIYRTGPGSRGYIRPKGGKKLALPGGHLAIGASRGKKGSTQTARFLDSVKGMRPQRIMRRARIESAPFSRETFKLHARLAKEEIKAMMKS